MFAVIYKFRVKRGMDATLVSTWTEITRLIYEHNGSLGSRLHLSGPNEYIAYAQWPSRDLWAASTAPPGSEQLRAEMRQACETIETLFELEPVSDLLQSETYQASRAGNATFSP